MRKLAGDRLVHGASTFQFELVRTDEKLRAAPREAQWLRRDRLQARRRSTSWAARTRCHARDRAPAQDIEHLQSARSAPTTPRRTARKGCICTGCRPPGEEVLGTFGQFEKYPAVNTPASSMRPCRRFAPTRASSWLGAGGLVAGIGIPPSGKGEQKALPTDQVALPCLKPLRLAPLRTPCTVHSATTAIPFAATSRSAACRTAATT